MGACWGAFPPHSCGFASQRPSLSGRRGAEGASTSACDTRTAHCCGRADEPGYDPKDHIILVANNAPLSVTAPHNPTSPYATFISADPPYAVLGHVIFAGAGGLEQPLWDRELRRFWITVPGPAGGSPT